MQLKEYLNKADCRRIVVVGPQAVHEKISANVPLVWVDGGVAHRAEAGLGFAVGDGDSAAVELHQYLNRAKHYSDLAYVLKCLPQGCAELVLLGFLGGRRDHEFFNLGEAYNFLHRANNRCKLRFDEEIFGYSKGEWRFELHCGFSLASIATARVKLIGACEYQLKRPTAVPPLSSLGLSNIGSGEIILTCDAPVFIFINQQ